MSNDPRTPLTARQKECYDAVRAYCVQHGTAPTHAELAQALDLRSESTVHKLLSSLEGRGWIVRSGRNMPRAYWPIDLELPGAMHRVNDLAAASYTIASLEREVRRLREREAALVEEVGRLQSLNATLGRRNQALAVELEEAS